jgi:uncharacterized protein
MRKYIARSFKWRRVDVPINGWHERRWLRSLLTQLFVLPILAYQYLIAPLLTDCCRFYPCCSSYTKEAISKHGMMKGIWMGIRRLARCHPWGGSGYDPVP